MGQIYKSEPVHIRSIIPKVFTEPLVNYFITHEIKTKEQAIFQYEKIFKKIFLENKEHFNPFSLVPYLKNESKRKNLESLAYFAELIENDFSSSLKSTN